MTGYAAVVAARFRMLLQYRGAALGGLATQTFFGLVRIMILDGFYRASATPPSLGFPQAVGYVWLGQATLALFPWNTDSEIRDQVRKGTVVYELCRPLDLYGLWYARAIAWRSAPTLLRMIPMFAFAAAVLPALGLGDWGLAPPAGVGAGIAWVAATVGALFLSCALTTLAHVGVLATLGADGVPALMATIASLLGGMVIPLPLFPDWAQGLLAALPFSGALDLPARLYVGHIAAADAVWVLAQQLSWTAILVVLGRWLLARQTRRLVVQGG
ncbi:MAG TPA: ABC-2 family transporter protein [Haliangiales bacterium]|nr:ABC-2 family transporter protein [Haliangiales bacterium]